MPPVVIQKPLAFTVLTGLSFFLRNMAQRYEIRIKFWRGNSKKITFAVFNLIEQLLTLKIKWVKLLNSFRPMRL